MSQNPKYMFLQTNDEDDEAFHAKLAAMQEISNSLLVKIVDHIFISAITVQNKDSFICWTKGKSSNQPPSQAISLQSIIFNSSSSSASTSDISTVTSDITNMSDEISSSKPYTLHNHTMSNLPLLNTLSLNAEMNALLSSQAIPTVTTTTAAALTASTASTSSPTTDLGTPITPTSDINVAALPLPLEPPPPEPPPLSVNLPANQATSSTVSQRFSNNNVSTHEAVRSETKESYLKQKRVYMREVRVDLEFPSSPLSLSPLLIIPISHSHAHHSHSSYHEQSPKPPLANITTRRTHFTDLQHDLSNMRQLTTLPTFCNLNGSNDHQYLHPSGIFFLCSGTGRGCIEVDPGNAEQAVRAQRIFYHNLDEYRAFHNCPPLTLCPHHSPTNFPLNYPPTYNPCPTFPVYILSLIHI